MRVAVRSPTIIIVGLRLMVTGSLRYVRYINFLYTNIVRIFVYNLLGFDSDSDASD